MAIGNALAELRESKPMDPSEPADSKSKPIRVVLYFPLGSTDHNRESEILPLVEDYLCRTFGGLTSYPAQGLYVREHDAIIQRESVQVLEIYASPGLWARFEEEFHHLGEALARVLDQQSVAITVEGVLTLKSKSAPVEGEDWPWVPCATSL